MVIITGTSSGIGYALAQHYLKEGKRVIGISRRKNIEHDNYQHILCDLSDPDAVEKLELDFSEKDELIFVHNAGILGNVQRYSDQTSSDLNEVFQVNLFSGATIIQKILQKAPSNQSLKIGMISSGAAKNAIPSWAAYCASKSALEIWTETMYLEELEKGRTNFTVYSISPGVVDTEMQQRIRNVHQTEFSAAERFRAFKENGELVNPELIAKKIIWLFNAKYSHQTVFNLKEITL